MILALLLVIAHSLIDWYQIEKMKVGINHPVELAIFVVASVIGAMIVLNPWFVVLCLGVRLLMFDYLLNLLRGRSWDYLGEGAMSDRILKKLNKWIVMAMRGLLFALSIILYYEIN